ncbi:MAG: ATP-binding protein, partial [Planctomycetota bacterium]
IAMHRLRLVLGRRILWLRRLWRDDSLSEYRGLVISDGRADRLLAGNDREAEREFYRQNPEAVELTRSIDETQDRLVSGDQSLHPSALQDLAGRFELLDFEIDLLTLCLAPEVEPELGRLYAYCQDDANRQYATGRLADSLFGLIHGEDAADILTPDGTLRRYRLITVADGCTAATPLIERSLQLDERVRCYLQGNRGSEPRLASLLRPLERAAVPPGHRRLATDLAETMGEMACRRVNLVGPTDAGQRAVAGLVCDELDTEPRELAAEGLPPGRGEMQEYIDLLNREARLADLALYVDIADGHASCELRELAHRFEGILLVSSRTPWRSQPQMIDARLHRAAPHEQIELWRRALGDGEHSPADVVAQFDFGPEAISYAAAQARLMTRGGGMDEETIWNACRRTAAVSMNGLATRMEPVYGWKDIVLPDDSALQLREIAGQVAGRSRVYRDWGFGDKLARGRGITALFCGPSGTGKTMAAEVLATHLQLDLYRIDLAEIINKYVGETEKNLRKVFEAAEQAGAILFFDEADALFGRRTEVRDSHDRYANIEVDYLLQRMEDYRGLAILATNRRSALDRALLRRLRFVVEFPFPDIENRRQIWQKVFPERAELGNVDYDALARLEVAGGNIRNIALNAAFIAAQADESIQMHHLMHAARREYAKIDKMVTDAQFGGNKNIERSRTDA